MRLSVVIPVRNESVHIRRTLEGLLTQTLSRDDYEILIVDGVSDDDTVDIVQTFQATHANVFLLHNPKRLSSAARNIGVQHARGDYVLIVDGHCEINDPDHLSKVIEAFVESGADCLGRPQPLRSREPSTFQHCVAAARMSWLGHNPHSAIFSDMARFVPADNVAVAYRREVFEIVGLFDESFDACEDVDFNTRVRRAGLSCYFTPNIVVDYQARSSLTKLAFQMMRYGRGRSRLGRKYPATITLPSLVPPLWLLWLLAGAIASFFGKFIAMAYLASITAYALILVMESARVARTSRVPISRLPLIFAAIHAGFGWGYWKEWLVGGTKLAEQSALIPQTTLLPR